MVHRILLNILTKSNDYSCLLVFERSSSLYISVITNVNASGVIMFSVIYVARMGSQLIIPYRGDAYFTRELKVSGEVGQILFLVIFYTVANMQ